MSTPSPFREVITGRVKTLNWKLGGMVTHHLELGGDPKMPGFDKDDVDTTKLVQTVEKSRVVDFVKTMGKSTIHTGCFSK